MYKCSKCRGPYLSQNRSFSEKKRLSGVHDHVVEEVLPRGPVLVLKKVPHDLEKGITGCHKDLNN